MDTGLPVRGAELKISTVFAYAYIPTSVVAATTMLRLEYDIADPLR